MTAVRTCASSRDKYFGISAGKFEKVVGRKYQNKSYENELLGCELATNNPEPSPVKKFCFNSVECSGSTSYSNRDFSYMKIALL
jgi:hypothetical protein